MIAMLLLGSVFSWCVAFVKRVYDQRAVVQRIEQLGGIVNYDYQVARSPRPLTPPGNRYVRALLGDDAFARVHTVSFSQPVTNADLSVVASLPDVARLYVRQGNMDGRGLAHLSSLTRLDVLWLSDCSLTTTDLSRTPLAGRLKCLGMNSATVNDAVLTYVAKLTSLEQLSIWNAAISDEGVESISRCTGLRSLELVHCPTITDKGYARLGALKSLRHLWLDPATLDPAAMAVFAELPQLETLHLCYLPPGTDRLRSFQELTALKILMLYECQVTDAEMIYLQGMRQLEHLALGWSSITDEALGNLCSFKQLKKLELITRNTTDAGIEHLQKLNWLEAPRSRTRHHARWGIEAGQGTAEMPGRVCRVFRLRRVSAAGRRVM